MTEATMTCRDVYARHTSTDGKSFVSTHRVWDADRFFAARATEAAKLNADVKGDAPKLAKCEQITREQFLADSGKR